MQKFKIYHERIEDEVHFVGPYYEPFRKALRVVFGNDVIWDPDMRVFKVSASHLYIDHVSGLMLEHFGWDKTTTELVSVRVRSLRKGDRNTIVWPLPLKVFGLPIITDPALYSTNEHCMREYCLWRHGYCGVRSLNYGETRPKVLTKEKELLVGEELVIDLHVPVELFGDGKKHGLDEKEWSVTRFDEAREETLLTRRADVAQHIDNLEDELGEIDIELYDLLGVEFDPEEYEPCEDC